MPVRNRYVRVLDRLFQGIRYVSGVTASLCIFLMVCTIVPDSLGRYFFSKPLYGTLEFNMLLMSAIVFLSLAWAQSRRGHVRVEVLISHTGPRLTHALNLFCWLVALALFGMITIGGVDEALRSFKIGENLWGVAKMPLWPGKMVAAFGAGLLCVQLILDIFSELVGLLTPRTSDEEKS